MTAYEANEIIMKQLCKEVEQIAENIQKNQTMSAQELDRLDKIYHTKKDMLTVTAMEDADEYANSENNQNGNGMSGYRGRAMNGRYVSKDSNESYSEGYSRGYSEAMNRMNASGGNYYPHRW